MIKNIFINYLQRFWAIGLTIYVSIAFRFYFRRWQVHNLPKMTFYEPVIYVANHQNAFLDAFAIIFSQKRQPIFLVRANIFATLIARIALRWCNMFPIYRKLDGGNPLEKNEKIIRDCIDMLKDGRQPLAIFVEGNHSMMRMLRPIKKGVARIAFSTLEQSDFKMKLKIIPIGLAYNKHTRGRSDLLVNFGKPLLVNDYLATYKDNPNKAYLEITDDISSELTKLVVNIPDSENYEEIEKAWISEKVIYDNMLDELHNDQQIIDRLIKEKQQGKTLIPLQQRKKKKSVVLMVLGFPAFIYGSLNSLLLYFIVSRLLKKMVTDVHFYGSIKVGASAFVGPFCNLLQAFSVYALSGGNMWLAVIYFASLPFFTIFAHDYFINFFADEPITTSSAELIRGYN